MIRAYIIYMSHFKLHIFRKYAIMIVDAHPYLILQRTNYSIFMAILAQTLLLHYSVKETTILYLPAQKKSIWFDVPLYK